MRSMKSLVRSNEGTLYQQVLSRLTEAIESGKIGAGDKLPTEAELVQSYGISRTTARRALDELRRQGLVRREPGRGTFRSDPILRADLPYLHSFSDEIRRLGYRPGAKLLLQSAGVADQSVAAQLSVDVGSPILYIRRLRTADEKPIFVCDSYLPLTRFPALGHADYSVTSLHELFEQTIGQIVRATQWIGVTTVDPDIAALLGIETGSSVLRLHRVTYVADNLQVESVQAFFHPNRYQHYSELMAHPATMNSPIKLDHSSL
ncbi:MAG: GntR family transcriptional regulator [Ktedonobacteraceae bacterium]